MKVAREYGGNLPSVLHIDFLRNHPVTHLKVGSSILGLVWESRFDNPRFQPSCRGQSIRMHHLLPDIRERDFDPDPTMVREVVLEVIHLKQKKS